MRGKTLTYDVRPNACTNPLCEETWRNRGYEKIISPYVNAFPKLPHQCYHTYQFSSVGIRETNESCDEMAEAWMHDVNLTTKSTC